MMYFAVKDPANGEAQIKQLMCLRTLAEKPELFRKVKDKTEALMALRRIASGAMANDEQGFGKEYALRALAVLEGGIDVEPPGPVGLALHEGLDWFPAEAS